MSQESAKIVSSEDELLILVDENDNQSGTMSKAACHDGDGVLHRAFSVFLFNRSGELLLQQRAQGKRLWPGFWSNSCCSHPRQGESIEVATSRRLSDELQTHADLEFVYRFTYQATFGALGAEKELCHVLLGSLAEDPQANETEIEALRYLSARELDRELAETPDVFTPWFKLEWERLNSEFSDTLARYTSPV